jgi:hypothetical protein
MEPGIESGKFSEMWSTKNSRNPVEKKGKPFFGDTHWPQIGAYLSLTCSWLTHHFLCHEATQWVEAPVLSLACEGSQRSFVGLSGSGLSDALLKILAFLCVD